MASARPRHGPWRAWAPALLGLLAAHELAGAVYARMLRADWAARPPPAMTEAPPLTGVDEPDPLVDALMDDDDASVQPAGVVPKPTPTPARSSSSSPSPSPVPFSAATAVAETGTHAHAHAQTPPAGRVIGPRDLLGLVGHLADLLRAAVRPLLLALLWISAARATLLHAHLALRPACTHAGRRRSLGVQAAALAAVVASELTLWARTAGSPAATEDLVERWTIVSGALLALAACGRAWWALPRQQAPGQREERGLAAWAAVPLYAVMLAAAGCYFWASERHGAGLAIYLRQVSGHALIYAQVALYLWAGMIVQHTTLAERLAAALRPWCATPTALAAALVALAAWPTAISGASGIFILAAGSVVYSQVRAAGGSAGLAQAATAMSGSLGVVLSPCLLVVVVASLNRDVSTEALYGYGRWVYLLTATLFGLACWALGRGGRATPWTAEKGQRVAVSLAALRGLLPALLALAATWAAFRGLLGLGVDEHSAPFFLPMALAAVLVAERRRLPAEPLAAAADHAAVHIGALLALMAASACLGGVVQRADLLRWVPTTFSSPEAAMAALVAALLAVGTCMDPYGAVVLVSATLAPLAPANGIDPAHFWMVALVTFELGYLLPPVALNQLLARRVAGQPPPRGADARLALTMPLAVMATALAAVAVLPLWWARH